MAVAHRNPWTEFETFERVLNRAFDLPLSRLLSNDQPASWQPRIDVYETEAAYVVEADLPGMTAHNFTVQLEGTTVVIAGERKNPHSETAGKHTRIERLYGPFQRTFTLPTAVKSDEVQANYANGVLTVTVPKTDAARPRQVTVQAA